MNMHNFLRMAAQRGNCAMPILSFPAVKRLNVSVGELVHSAELQAKAIVTIAKETPTIAAVSLMDLSVEAEAFGAKVKFSDDEVPAVIESVVDIDTNPIVLKLPTLAEGRAKLCIEAIRQAKQRIENKPVFAGMIGPFSLAGRLMDVTEIMYICYDEPEKVHEVLKVCNEYLVNYAMALIEAGADGIVVAEPLAGVLSPAMAKEFSHCYIEEIIKAVQDEEHALIYHNCGNSVPMMLDDIFEMHAAAYHFGNASDMQMVLEKAPDSCICMGNIDPVSRFVQGTPAEMKVCVKSLIEKCGKYKNFILSSGCDIPAKASWDNINAFFDAIE